MSEDAPLLPPRTHNLPDIHEILHAETIAALIEAELDRTATSVDGNQIPSLRARDQALVSMCHRFLRAYPRVTTEEVAKIAADVLHTCQAFASGTGRLERTREAFKAPVLAAGRQIDAAFGKLGQLLIVRPLNGPPRGRRIAPLTLAEQISERMITFIEEEERKKREAAEAEAKRLEEQAQLARDLAAKGPAVTQEDVTEVEKQASAQRRAAAAPVNEITRVAGNMAGSVSGRRVRTFTIVNPALVPRNLCTPDERLIRAFIGAADSPIPEVPGLTIKDVTDLNRR